MQIPTDSWFYRSFFRDVDIPTHTIRNLVVRGLILTLQITYWLYKIIAGTSSYEFDFQTMVILFLVAGITLLFGGIVIDYFIHVRFLFEIIAIIGIGFMILILNIVEIAIAFPIFIGYGIVLALTTILYFTNFLVYTTLLSRSRVVALISFVIIGSILPIVALIVITTWVNGIWIVTIALIGISIIFTKKYPFEVQAISRKDRQKITFQKFFNTLKQSQTIPYIVFVVFGSCSLGFYLSLSVFQFIQENIVNYAILIGLAGAVSFPIIAIMLDKFGRKSAAFLTLFLMGLVSIFFDYPESQMTFFYNEFRLAIFSFVGILLIIISVVVAGDLSSLFSRGRIMGAFLFAFIFGTILGIIISFQIRAHISFDSMTDMNIISDWATFIIWIGLLLVLYAKDTYEHESPDWRDFLNRLIIISRTGISLYSVDFKDKDAKIMDEDLVSGGLSGLQSMMQEIARSKSKVQVVDHGDQQILFHYGEDSDAVLFTTKNITVLREKLANFHNQFEYKNRVHIHNFNGNLSKLVGLDLLKQRYFT